MSFFRILNECLQKLGAGVVVGTRFSLHRRLESCGPLVKSK